MTTSNRPPSCDKLKPKLKECPFCGVLPEKFSPMFSRDRLRVVEAVKHPITNKCPLDMLVFRLSEWNKRNSIPRRSEVAELLRLVDSVIDTPDWTRRDEVEELIRRSTKLRKEWKL